MKFSTEAIQGIGQIIAEEMERLGIKAGGIFKIEQVMRELIRACGQVGLQKYLEKMDREPRIEDKQKMTYHSTRKAVIWSVFGKVSFYRRYYRYTQNRGGKRQGIALLDQELGIEAGQVTPCLGELLALAGVETAFEKATQLVKKFLLFQVSDNTLRKETECFGELQQTLENSWKKQSQEVEWQLRQKREQKQIAGRIYGSIDGVMVPLKDGWHELKAIAWYRVGQRRLFETKRHHGSPPGTSQALQTQEITYHCDMQAPEEFGKLVWGTGCQRHVNYHEEVVFVNDGAAWIWKLVEQWFPKAIQITDWYHACEYLAPIATAVLNPETPAYQEWLDDARTLLWEGAIDDLILLACQAFADQPAAEKAVHAAVTYYTNNKNRMDYAHFREEGYFIGSGTIESGVKQIAGLRLKQAGAQWTQDGAVATAKARAAWLGQQWDTLVALRANLPLAD